MADPGSRFLGEVLGDVLGDAAFAFGDPCDAPAAWSPPTLLATIAYECDGRGVLRLLAEPSAAAELAANMLGLEPGDPAAADHSLATVAELLNVIGGTYLTRRYGSGVPSLLGLPVARVLN
ncbi:MAG TPA: hypothetical protein VD838_14285, partial [Anaeromyxobacteraceae bacterium]|nr:hypothetical protein [Anaeromyxobacteraceae bacterium]